MKKTEGWQCAPLPPYNLIPNSFCKVGFKKLSPLCQYFMEDPSCSTKACFFFLCINNVIIFRLN